MADPTAQVQWRRRKKLGLIQKILCSECGKLLRSDSKSLYRSCWLLTAEGKEYTRKKVAKHRAKLQTQVTSR